MNNQKDPWRNVDLLIALTLGITMLALGIGVMFEKPKRDLFHFGLSITSLIISFKFFKLLIQLLRNR